MLDLYLFLAIVFCQDNPRCLYDVKDCILDGETYEWCTEDYKRNKNEKEQKQ